MSSSLYLDNNNNDLNILEQLVLHQGHLPHQRTAAEGTWSETSGSSPPSSDVTAAPELITAKPQPSTYSATPQHPVPAL